MKHKSLNSSMSSVPRRKEDQKYGSAEMASVIVPKPAIDRLVFSDNNIMFCTVRRGSQPILSSKISRPYDIL